MKNCIVRTYKNGCERTKEYLHKKQSKGWIVKSSTPFINAKGQTEYIEYILEKEDNLNDIHAKV